jgi:hypothetical protein
MNSSHMLRRIRSRLARSLASWRHRGRVLIAMMLLTVFGVAQRVVPMPRWSRVLGRVGAVPNQWMGKKVDTLPLRLASLPEARAARAIVRASKALPWKPTCLAEAAAGQCLLRMARTSGVVVIGLRKTDLSVKDSWDAHAWLLGQRGAITGGPAATGFTATTVYEVRCGLRATDIDLVTVPRST